MAVVVSFISSIASYRLSHTVFPPVLSVFALFTGDCLQKLLLKIDFNFKETTTGYCSVPMLKLLSDEAGPSP